MDNGDLPSMQYASHNVIDIDTITFSSNFDNGNLAHVEKVPNKPFEYRIWSAPDNLGSEYESKHSTWFYFTITGLPSGCTLKLNIMNSNKHGALYRYDMRPVFRSHSTNNQWIRIRSPVKYQKEDEGSPLSFEHIIDHTPHTTISFAFTYPYSYTTLQQELTQYWNDNCDKLNQLDNPDCIYYTQELLTESCDHRRVDLLTISSCYGVSEEHEPLLEDLFPDLLTPSSRTKRPLIFPNKEIIFISSRVHPGEVPSQFTLKGILDFILDENDLRAKELRKRYVFKIIPMLNPDGVYRGHFRMDQYGNNLNRYYLSPSLQFQPSIFAIKQLLSHHSSHIALYLDLHAHATKRGCFIYGNVLNNLELQIQNQLFCKLISLNTPHFDYNGCLFSKDHMSRVDAGDGLTAEGSGRVSTYLQYGLIHSYTLECNYNMSKYQNEITNPQHPTGGQYLTPSSPYSTTSEKYTPAIYAGVGRACMIALLDIRGHNPCSRIPTSKYKTLERVRYAVISEVKLRPEYRGQVVSNGRKKATPYQVGNGRSRNQEEGELFNWCRRVEVTSEATNTNGNGMDGNGPGHPAATITTTGVGGVGAGVPTSNSTSAHANANTTAGGTSSAWFISTKGKKRRGVGGGSGNGKSPQDSSLEEATTTTTIPSYRQPTSSSRASEGGSTSIFPMISNESDPSPGLNELNSELRHLKLCLNNGYECSPPLTEKSTTRPSLAVPALIPRGPKSRPQSFPRTNLKEKIISNSNISRNKTKTDHDRGRDRDRESPVGESSLILTGRSVTTADSSSSSSCPSSGYLNDKETEQMTPVGIKYEGKLRIQKIIDDSMTSSTYTATSTAYQQYHHSQQHSQQQNQIPTNEITTQQSSRERLITATLHDLREDYVPFSLQKSPRRPHSSKTHRALTM